MSIVIERVQAASPALAEFLVAHHAELEHTAPAESRHALVFERLLAPGVRLFAAHLDDAPVATGALATVEEGHEEIKSMRTDPALRGQGLGRAMLAFLLADAESRASAASRSRPGARTSSSRHVRCTPRRDSASAARSAATRSIRTARS